MSKKTDQPIGSVNPVKQMDGRALPPSVPSGDVSPAGKPAPVRPPRTSSRSAVIAGLLIVGLTFMGGGIWAATAPLGSAVTAQGVLVAIGRQRTVQHLEGGIVTSIQVNEGDFVKAGDLLLELDPTPAKASADRLQSQLDVQMAIRDRLRAELFGWKDIEFDKRLLGRKDEPGPATAMEVQGKEFHERQKTLEGTIGVLEQRIEQLNRSIDGYEAQRAAKHRQEELILEEMESMAALLDKGLARRSTILQLQRASAELTGEIGEIDASIARSGEQIGEAQLQIIQTKQEFREQVVGRLAEAEAHVSDLLQQLIVAEDVLKRVQITAPISGVVQNLNFTTIGGVVGSREPLMEIAPDVDDLLVEAQVSPLDIDKVTIGQEAEVRFSALDLRSTPSVFGRVTTKSGDRIIEQANQVPYYRVQIATTLEELNKLGDQTLQAGMPAEVLIKTRDRTLLNYLTKPLTDAMARGLREE